MVPPDVPAGPVPGLRLPGPLAARFRIVTARCPVGPGAEIAPGRRAWLLRRRTRPLPARRLLPRAPARCGPSRAAAHGWIVPRLCARGDALSTRNGVGCERDGREEQHGAVDAAAAMRRTSFGCAHAI